MSDQKLRELERRWGETGSVEDEAAYLRERVRVGDLTQERLELAACCGHEGASNALGVSPQVGLIDTLSARLAGWPAGYARRVALAAARCCAQTWTRTHRGDPLLSRLVDVCTQAIVSSDPKDRERLIAQADEADAAADRARSRQAYFAAQAVFEAIQATFVHDHLSGGVSQAALLRAKEAVGETLLLAAIRMEVAPWALGEFDPLVIARPEP